MEAKGKRQSRAAAGPQVVRQEPAPQAAPPAAPSVVEAAAPVEPAPAEPAAAKPAAEAGAPADLFALFGGEAEAAFASAQASLARGVSAVGGEMLQLARVGVDNAAQSATGLLAARTVADAIEVNAGFARSSFDALVDASARLGELAVQMAADSAQPLLTQLGKGWALTGQPKA